MHPQKIVKKINDFRIKLLQKVSLRSTLARLWKGYFRSTIDFMTGRELHQMLLDKWGCSFDVQLRKVKGKIYAQVMWKYLEQASFPLSPTEYMEHLDRVAEYLSAWGVMPQVEGFIDKTKERPRLGKAVSIPLDLGDRTTEWILDD
jgi:hypothetical protein